MKKVFFAVAALAVAMSSCQHHNNVTLKENQDTISYALGLIVAENIAGSFKQYPFDTIDVKTVAQAFQNSKPSKEYLDYVKPQLGEIDSDIFMAAFTDQIETGSGKIKHEDAEMVLNRKAMQVQAQKRAERAKLAEQNEKEGKEFLEANAKAEGVVTLESGLQYKILKKGNGEKPTIKDRVKVNYRGTLLDGTEFDASKEPATFGLTGIIKGWSEALQLMPVGSKWQVYIPAPLAYGEQGGGPKIGPNATLIFDIELLEIVK